MNVTAASQQQPELWLVNMQLLCPSTVLHVAKHFWRSIFCYRVDWKKIREPLGLFVNEWMNKLFQLNMQNTIPTTVCVINDLKSLKSGGSWAFAASVSMKTRRVGERAQINAPWRDHKAPRGCVNFEFVCQGLTWALRRAYQCVPYDCHLEEKKKKNIHARTMSCRMRIDCVQFLLRLKSMVED